MWAQSVDKTSASIDDLMQMVGLESVKDLFIQFFSRELIKKRRKDKTFERRSACLTGNPGTGKVGFGCRVYYGIWLYYKFWL